MRRVRRLTVALAAIGTVSGALLAAGPALAAESYGLKGTFGSSGSGEGLFSEPMGVAVNDSTEPLIDPTAEDVYVVDKGNNRVEYFSSTGAYIGQFNGTEIDGVPAGVGKEAPAKFSEPESIAVDNDPSSASHGDVYVVDNAQHVIDRFSATGEYKGQLTGTCPAENETVLAGTCEPSKSAVIPFEGPLRSLAVDPEGHLWVSIKVLYEFSDTGGYERTVVPPNKLAGSGMAFDSEEDFYLPCECNPGELLRLTPTGESLNRFSDQGLAVTGLAIAPATNGLFVDEGSSIAETGPFGSEAPKSFGVGRLIGSGGIAVNASGLLYATDSANDDVSIFAPGIGEPPLITEQKSITAGQALGAVLLEADMDPVGSDTIGCAFQYGADPSLATHTTVPCNREEFESLVVVPVQAVISGLATGETYYFRVTGINIPGGKGAGAIDSFQMPNVPVLGISEVENVSGTAAALSGEVDPERTETVYHFAYVDQAGYEKALAGDAEEKADPYADGESTPAVNVGAGNMPQTIPVTLIEGMQPGRTYHYALVAYNIVGTTITPDRMFTTPAGTPPLVSTGPASAVSQNAATLSGTVTTNGLQTNYGFEIATELGHYGPATGLGSIGGAATEAVTSRLSKLQPGTTYYYRVAATNADGTVEGEPQVFTTPGFPTLIAVPLARPQVAVPNVAFPREEGVTTGSTPRTLTHAQKLSKALKACHAKDKHNRARRRRCEKAVMKKSRGV